MAAFAVLGPPDNQLLKGAIERNFPRRFFIAPGQWVVAETGLTAQQVSERIGLNGSAGKFVVFSSAGHFGYHDKNLWEWLTLNSG
jgi:hypothetical protein